MGILALAARLVWFAGEWHHWPTASRQFYSHPHMAMKVLWVILVLTIGVQLIFCSDAQPRRETRRSRGKAAAA